MALASVILARTSGRWYDQSGRYQGRESRDGSRYDSSGRYQGRTR